MRLCFLVTAVSALALAQSATRTISTDLNGNPLPRVISSDKNDGTTTQRMQSMNGQKVPLEQVEEKVVREDASGKVLERTIKRFDPTGRLSSTERVRVEEEKLAGGGSNVRETTWRSDVSGNLRETERRSIETRVSGSRTTMETAVARPNMNGGFETDEKRSLVSEKIDSKTQSSESVLRRDTSGGFYEAVREVKTVESTSSGSTESAAVYEPGITGRMELARQSVTTSTPLADGGEVKQVNLYAATVEGRAQEPGTPQRLKEQQLIERRKNPDGSVVETVSVRRPSISQPERLGNAQTISETVCVGKCETPAPGKP